MIYTVYILYSEKTERYYIGATQNLKDRLERHNQGRSKATKAGAPYWKIIYVEEFPTLSEARRRESYIKKMKSRKYIQRLIEKGD